MSFAEQVLDSGLIVGFLGGFEGSVDILHLPSCGGSGQNLGSTYSVNSKVTINFFFPNSFPYQYFISLNFSITLILLMWEPRAHQLAVPC